MGKAVHVEFPRPRPLSLGLLRGHGDQLRDKISTDPWSRGFPHSRTCQSCFHPEASEWDVWNSLWFPDTLVASSVIWQGEEQSVTGFVFIVTSDICARLMPSLVSTTHHGAKMCFSGKVFRVLEKNKWDLWNQFKVLPRERLIKWTSPGRWAFGSENTN